MMKKIIALLTGIILINSCSSTNDENTTVVVPVSPTNLSGINSENAQITLTWTDNSTNETEFKIERKTGTEVFSIIGTTKVDVTNYIDTNIINGISYTYRVYAYNSAGNSPTYSNEFKITPYGLPILTTTPITTLTTTSINTGGNITDSSGLTINSRGVVWSNTSNPSTSTSNKTIDGNGSGVYTSTINSLLPDTAYYIRAYAINSKGTSYGNEIIYKTLPIFTIGGGVTDICGNSYPTIILQRQEWMQKNLDVCKYRNGDIIPEVQNFTEWSNLKTGAWCYYENKTENGTIYGKLYNRYAITDPRGIAPKGWHIPSTDEWNNLYKYLGESNNIVGAKMIESKKNKYWCDDYGNNESGFTVFPGGQRNAVPQNYSTYGGNYGGSCYLACFWSSDSAKSNSTNYSEVGGSFVSIQKSYYSYIDITKYPNQNDGYSIRCVKD
ncbi:FISUMP domain-containing protein [Flavobacterium sp. 7E]|uniref:FISUMP domain-containing protein n=1 Tax=Flavobacterium sp. 7E TaxID=2735898 RepID=UPI00156F713F|nr:FISUMP domain-containing protein [Flavobacterium sp. 7E]